MTQTLVKTMPMMMSVSKLIEVAVPRTGDRGDALAAAVQIADAAIKAVAHESNFTVTCQSSRIQIYLTKQYLAYLKGGE